MSTGTWVFFRQKLIVPSLRSLNGLRRSGVHEAVRFRGTLDVVVNSFMMAQGKPLTGVSELVLWMNGLERKLPRWIAATLYLRAMGLRHSILDTGCPSWQARHGLEKKTTSTRWMKHRNVWLLGERAHDEYRDVNTMIC